MAGCNQDEQRLVDMATRQAERQAQQSRDMVRLQEELAQGSRQLIEADAQARQELAELQRDLQREMTELARRQDQIESERKELAHQRHRDPLVASAMTQVGLIVACCLPLAVAIYVLAALRREHHDDHLVDVLVQDLIAERPRLLISQEILKTIPGDADDEGTADPKPAIT
jgi:hypothetical protein